MAKPLHPVTLPTVIVDAKSLDTADGWCFPNHDDSVAVQVVKVEDIQARLRKIFSEADASLFAGLKQLESAHDNKDGLALTRAIGKVARKSEKWNLVTRGRSGSHAKVNWIGVRWIYSSRMSKALRMHDW